MSYLIKINAVCKFGYFHLWYLKEFIYSQWADFVVGMHMYYEVSFFSVVQGRHLSSKWRKQAHSFVLVSIIPDDTNTTRCRTAIVKETNSPTFNEKFSL